MRLPIIVILAFATFSSNAQIDPHKFEVGINAGTYIYQGDLAPAYAGSFKTPGPAVGLQFTRKLNRSLSARLEFSKGRLKGDDARYSEIEWRSHRNFAFTTRITEIVGSVVWTPALFTGRLKPYAFAGAGVAFIDVTRDYSNYNPEYFAATNVTASLQEDVATPIPNQIPVIPVGIGLRYEITDRISLVPEASFRHISSDYLDGYSKSGTPERKDKYFKYSLGLTYSFSVQRQYGCPTVKL